MKAAEEYQQEEWREVPGCPGYEISSLGRLCSYKKGKITILNPPVDINSGYRHTALMVNGEPKQVRIHNIVCEAFIGPRPPHHCTHHKDSDKTNNSKENLMYVHSKVHGQTHNPPFLCAAEIAEVRDLFLNHVDNISELADLIGTSRNVIWRCIKDLLDDDHKRNGGPYKRKA